MIIVCFYVYMVLLHSSVLIMSRMLYAVIYIVLMIASGLLFVEAMLLTGNLLLAVPLAVLSMALLFADVIIWYRYIHPAIIRNAEILIAVVFTSFMLLMILFLLGSLYLAPVSVMQATLASTGLIDGWSRVKELVSRPRQSIVKRIHGERRLSWSGTRGSIHSPRSIRVISRSSWFKLGSFGDLLCMLLGFLSRPF